MSNFDCAIGDRLNNALTLRKVKQKELASHLGVTDNTISYYCSGKRTPSVQQIAEISKYLGVSADYLLGLSQNPTILKATSIYTLEFTFIGAAASENHAEDAKRFAEYLREHTIADDVRVLSSKIFLHDTPER